MLRSAKISIVFVWPVASVKLTEKLLVADGLIGVAPEPDVSDVLKLLKFVIVAGPTVAPEPTIAPPTVGVTPPVVMLTWIATPELMAVTVPIAAVAPGMVITLPTVKPTELLTVIAWEPVVTVPDE